MNRHQPLNIILLGDPAAGKATHGKFLETKYRLYNLDMGKELRKIQNPSLAGRQAKSEIRKILNQTLDKGKLTPTVIVRKILRDKIHSTPKNKGILFNGTPKMLGEAKLVAKWLDKEKRRKVLFIYLSIALTETIRRMTARKTYFKGKFSKRPDDNNKALKNRLDYYRRNIRQVVAYFKKLYPFIKISTQGSIGAARQRLVKNIDELQNRLN